MKAKRYQGIYTKGISTAYGSDIINIKATNDNSVYSSSISVNDNVIESNNTDNGFIIVVFNPDLSVRRNRFLPVKSVSESNNFVTFINSVVNINVNLLIAVASIGNLERDDHSILNNFFNNKGSNLWSKRELFSDTDENQNPLRDQIPYCFLMSTELGIVYENYGYYDIQDNDDNAALNVPYHDINSFGMNGYGLNLIGIDEYTDSNNSSTTQTYPINSVDPSQNIRLFVKGRIENLDQYPSRSARVNIQENGSNIHTYIIDSNIWKEFDQIISVSSSNNYQLIIEKDSDILLDISNIEIVKAGYSSVTTDVKFKLNRENENISCFNVIESLNNVDISDEQDYETAFNNNINPFTLDNNTFLYKNNKDSVSINTTLTSDFIQIDNRIDYIFSTWFKGTTSGSIIINAYFYDSSQNLIDVEYFDKQYSNTVSLSEYNITPDQYGYAETYILSKTADRYDLNRFNKIDENVIDDNGNGLEKISSNVPKTNNNVSYIKLEITSNGCDMILPFISEIKFGMKNDGTLLGPVIEHSGV